MPLILTATAFAALPGPAGRDCRARLGLVHGWAQAPTGVFAGKTGNLIIGFGPGGGYDLWARTVARHIGRHLPGNPTVTAQNMEGAGSYGAANFIYSVAPKDGTAFALIARDAPLGPLTGAPGAQFDATKLSWLGTPAIETNCIANRGAPVKTAPDLLEKQLVVGDTGPGRPIASAHVPYRSGRTVK
jgi:tripartite-type tricarboxylate transporter receptor subunit TctC